jgi:hypothetical protein
LAALKRGNGNVTIARNRAMQPNTRTRAGVAAPVHAMINAVMVGTALITVLAVPYFRAHAETGIAAAVLISLVAAAPAAWLIAPRLHARARPRR